jgi:hypothetical protein
VRLYSQSGTLLVEKRISAIARPGDGDEKARSEQSAHEVLINEALQNSPGWVVT